MMIFTSNHSLLYGVIFMTLLVFICFCGCIDNLINPPSNVYIVDGPQGTYYEKIQDAIDNCEDYATIRVSPGIYRENIQVTKPITIRSEDVDQTIIDGNFSGDVIQITSEDVIIDGFTIMHSGVNSHFSDYDVGVAIVSNQVTIKNCIFHNNTGGIEIRSDTNHITSCHFHHNDFGLYAILSNEDIISNNIFQFHTTEGVWIYSGNNIVISENKFIDNEIGMKIKNAQENRVKQNLFKRNVQGLYLCCGSMNNSMSHNSFMNNSKRHIFDITALNQFYDLGEFIGNYWDDYGGKDANNDGIGDESYLISNDRKKQDYYPLMEPLIDEYS